MLLGWRLGGYGQEKWGLPQGFMEFEEDFLSAAIRETREETGLEVRIRSIINVVSNFLTPYLHSLAIILLAEIVAGEPHAADDLESLEWFPLNGLLPEMAFAADEAIIAQVQNMSQRDGLPVDHHFAG